MTLGEYLREKRQARGLGLRQLARNVGCSMQHLQKIETDTARPGASLLLLIARQLREDTDAFLLMADRVPPDVLAILKEQPEILHKIRGQAKDNSPIV